MSLKSFVKTQVYLHNQRRLISNSEYGHFCLTHIPYPYDTFKRQIAHTIVGRLAIVETDDKFFVLDIQGIIDWLTHHTSEEFDVTSYDAKKLDAIKSYLNLDCYGVKPIVYREICDNNDKVVKRFFTVATEIQKRMPYLVWQAWDIMCEFGGTSIIVD